MFSIIDAILVLRRGPSLPGFYSMVAVPSVVAVMNVFWFWKILKGIVKTFSRRKLSYSENGKTD